MEELKRREREREKGSKITQRVQTERMALECDSNGINLFWGDGNRFEIVEWNSRKAQC